MRRLVVNADDLGADAARNDGIFEAIAAGVVTSASILANGPAFDDAVARAWACRRPVSFGLHLNLSEGRPLARDLRLLVGPAGRFLGKAEARRRLSGSYDGASTVAEEVASEAGAQLEALLAAGLRVNHVDGHQHVHVFPGAAGVVAAVARRFGIRWVRVPDEPDAPADLGVPVERRGEIRAYGILAAAARGGFVGAGVEVADHFRGIALTGRVTPATLAVAVRELPEGLTELMVHPGRLNSTTRVRHSFGTAPEPVPENPFAAFSTEDRERELDALLDSSFRRALTAAEVELVPFP